MPHISIDELKLQNYRNILSFSINISSNRVIIIGPNGSGKTNILESLSLISPGKGIKNAHFDDICNPEKEDWNVDISLQSKLGKSKLSFFYTRGKKSRHITFNGSKISSSELLKIADVIWISPISHNVFSGSATDRRRFLDRLVFSFNSNHATTINQYDHYINQRIKYLIEYSFGDEPNSFLDKLEEDIAKLAIEIYFSRKNTIQELQLSIDALQEDFPSAKLDLTSSLNDAQTLDYYTSQLKAFRKQDGFSNRSGFGIHKDDFVVTYSEKNKIAKYCSTGEQKALIISLIMAQMMSLKKQNGITPLLLLDELFVHLDNSNKNLLSQMMDIPDLQSFITATDTSGLEKLLDLAQVIDLTNLQEAFNAI
jgi:DNA replication and repair protein RecF